jgi:hypothetical protein
MGVKIAPTSFRAIYGASTVNTESEKRGRVVVVVVLFRVQ